MFHFGLEVFRFQLSVFSCPFSVVSFPLSVFRCQFSVVSFPLSVFSCPFSVFNYQLSDVSLTRRRRGLAEGDWVSLLLRLVLAVFYWFGVRIAGDLTAVHGILRLESRSPIAYATVYGSRFN